MNRKKKLPGAQTLHHLVKIQEACLKKNKLKLLMLTCVQVWRGGVGLRIGNRVYFKSRKATKIKENEQ